MLRGTEAIHSLEQALASALASLRIPTTEFGWPALVEKAAQQAKAVFHGVATAHPSKQDASDAVIAFIRGDSLTDPQYHLIASALCEPIREQQGTRAVGHSRFESLLERYEIQAKNGDLWRLTWYGLLASYFSFDRGKAPENERDGWGKLRDMLRSTWPDINKESETRIVPDWIKVMRRESQLLTDAAADKYSFDYLNGHTDGVTQLAEDLGIPQSSWFWHAVVLGPCARAAISRTTLRLRRESRACSNCSTRGRCFETKRSKSFSRDITAALLLKLMHSYVTSWCTRMSGEIRNSRPQAWRLPGIEFPSLFGGWCLAGSTKQT